MIPGIPQPDSQRLLELIRTHQSVEKVVLYGSRDAVREAVVRELLPAGTESTWMAMIRSRNLASRTYNPTLAEEIAQLIANQYGKELRGLQKELRRRAEQNQ